MEKFTGFYSHPSDIIRNIKIKSVWKGFKALNPRNYKDKVTKMYQDLRQEILDWAKADVD